MAASEIILRLRLPDRQIEPAGHETGHLNGLVCKNRARLALPKQDGMGSARLGGQSTKDCALRT